MTEVIQPYKCGTCKFWLVAQAVPGGHSNGICRRYPPSVLPVARNDQGEIASQSFFPPMAESGWCGEYVMKVGLQ